MAEIIWSVKAYEHINEIAAFIEKDLRLSSAASCTAHDQGNTKA